MEHSTPKDLEVRFPYGNHGGISCAHCGVDESIAEGRLSKHGGVYGYKGCDCPGHLGRLIIDFSEMERLPERLRGFETWLDAEECENNGECQILSNSARMCPACRLQLAFFHTIYNAEAYWDKE